MGGVLLTMPRVLKEGEAGADVVAVNQKLGSNSGDRSLATLGLHCREETDQVVLGRQSGSGSEQGPALVKTSCWEKLWES